MTPSPELAAFLRRVSLTGLIVATIGGFVCVFGYVRLRDQFFPAYLTAFLYWLSLSLGCMGIAMIHGMTGGAWGRMIRRVLEAGYETLPLMAILFLPFWLDVGTIYEWADPEFVRHHASVAKKGGYLNVSGFQWRAIAYFGIWVLITWVLNRSSPNEERDSESLRARRLQKVSGLGFMFYGFTMSLAAVDWVMSLEPEWYSTMYGLINIAGQGVASLSFAVVIVFALRAFRPWSRIVTAGRLNDLGSLMLASVMFWAYCSYFQYLVIWSGNLPEENSWYVHRSRGGWEYLAISLILLHFSVPFFLLLSRPIKRNPLFLARVASLLLVMHYVDLYWIVTPGFQRESSSDHVLTFHWLHLATLVAIGGLWLCVFAWRLSIRLRLPIYDPELTEGMNERSRQSVTA